MLSKQQLSGQQDSKKTSGIKITESAVKPNIVTKSIACPN